jgi:hypothetical protein
MQVVTCKKEFATVQMPKGNRQERQEKQPKALNLGDLGVKK